MNLAEAKDVLLRTHIAALDLDERASSFVLESGPGVGKSEGVNQYGEDLCLELNEPVAITPFMMTTITSPDVRGFMMPLRPEPGQPLRTVFSIPPWYPTIENSWVVAPDGVGGVTWWRPGQWTGEMPEVGVLFLDEWGQADEDVKKPGAELILNGNVGTTFLPMGFRVVAAQNRMSDRSGTVREMMFIVNRRCLLSVEPHLPTWLNWVDRQPVAKRPHFMTVSFARFHPEIVFRNTLPDSTDPFCSPRALCRMDRDLMALRTDEEVENNLIPTSGVAREVCAGRIGAASSGQYYTHLRFADELPAMEDIEEDPMRAKLPPGRDARMVCAYKLAHHVNEENARNVLRYILRMEQEMQILSVGVINNDEKRRAFIVPLKEYQSWFMANKDLLRASQS